MERPAASDQRSDWQIDAQLLSRLKLRAVPSKCPRDPTTVPTVCSTCEPQRSPGLVIGVNRPPFTISVRAPALLFTHFLKRSPATPAPTHACVLRVLASFVHQDLNYSPPASTARPP